MGYFSQFCTQTATSGSSFFLLDFIKDLSPPFRFISSRLRNLILIEFAFDSRQYFSLFIFAFNLILRPFSFCCCENCFESMCHDLLHLLYFFTILFQVIREIYSYLLYIVKYVGKHLDSVELECT